MLTKFTAAKLIKHLPLDPLSFTIFFHLTHTNKKFLEELKTALLKYNLKLMRFKGRQLLKNANFVAWSTQPFLQTNSALLEELLTLKVIPLAFFSRGQIWTVSRLKKSGLGVLQPGADFSFFWKNFQQNSF